MPLWFNRSLAGPVGGNGGGTARPAAAARVSRLSWRDNLELSPWAKWSQYTIFPWKMCLHITLVVLITLQASMINSHYAEYSRAVGRSFANLFFPPADGSPDVGSWRYHIYDVVDSIKDARRLLDTYFRLPEISVDAVLVANATDPAASRIPLPRIALEYHDPHRANEVFVMHDASTPWPLQVGGPVQQWLNGSNGGLPEMRAFLDDLRAVAFDFHVQSTGWGWGVDRNRPVCVVWNLGFLYDLSVGGQFVVTMDYTPIARCSPLRLRDRYVIMCLLIGTLSLIYQVLLFRAAWKKYEIFRLLRGRLDTSLHSHHHPPSLPSSAFNSPNRSRHGDQSSGEPENLPLLAEQGRGGGEATRSYQSIQSVEGGRRPGSVSSQVPPSGGWEALTWIDKMEIFGLWQGVALLGNLCALTYTIKGIYTQVDIFIDSSLRLLIGLACMMLWLALIQYLEYEARFYVMILTLKRAVPRIGQFLLGIAPMFLGYALLGMILFGDRNPMFGSLLATVGTLFCVVNGDSIKVVLDSLGYMPVFGELYVCLYMMLFTYVVLMTCIAIVEEAFFSSAEYAHLVWTGEDDLAAKKGGGMVDFPAHDPHHPPPHYPQDADGDDGPVLMTGASFSSTTSGGGGGGGNNPVVHIPTPTRLKSRSGSTTNTVAFEPVLSSSTLPSLPSPIQPLPPPVAPPSLAVTRSFSNSPARGASTSMRADSPAFGPMSGMKRSTSGSRVMSAKLRQLIQEADAAIGELAVGGPGFAPVPLGEMGRSASASPTMSWSGSGGGGGGGGGGWPKRTGEETMTSSNVSEALNDLQTLLLRQVVMKRERGTIQTGGEGEDPSAAIIQAIEQTKEKLLRRGGGGGEGGGEGERARRPSSAMPALATQQEGEEEDLDETKKST